MTRASSSTLEHANRMNSSGLGVLMQVRRAYAKHKNGRIGIIHINKHITNLLRFEPIDRVCLSISITKQRCG